MATKFYLVQNANRKIRTHNKREIVCELIGQFAGTWRGVFKAEAAEDIAGLDKLVKDPASGVKEITAEDYAERMQKKMSLPTNFGGSHLKPLNTVPPAAARIINKPAIVVEGPLSSETEPAAGEPVDPASVLQTGDIGEAPDETPPAAEPEAKPVKAKAAKAKAAKASS
jgi:hypothetical protein